MSGLTSLATKVEIVSFIVKSSYVMLCRLSRR